MLSAVYTLWALSSNRNAVYTCVVGTRHGSWSVQVMRVTCMGGRDDITHCWDCLSNWNYTVPTVNVGNRSVQESAAWQAGLVIKEHIRSNADVDVTRCWSPNWVVLSPPAMPS